MALSEQFLEEDLHPIDIVEHLAEHHDWEFDRLGDDQIAMAVEGQWRTYSVTLAWSGFDETLRMVCTFELDPPEEKLAQLYELINMVNDQCWAGAFTNPRPSIAGDVMISRRVFQVPLASGGRRYNGY